MSKQPKSTVTTTLIETSKGTACTTVLNGQISIFDAVAHIASVAESFLQSGMPITPEMLHVGVSYAADNVKCKNGGVVFPHEISPDDIPPDVRHN